MLTRLMKKRKKEEDERNLEIDRLSSLPEELVIHILSFLETKEAIQASLSLKKWVNLWTLIPILHFDTSLFKNISSFDKFVSKVLALHDGSVNISKFLYRRRNMFICEFQPEVLKFVVSHGVQDLTIDAGNQGDDLMGHVGSCDSVRSLKLCSSGFRGSICLNKVVTLNLQQCVFFEPELFSGCPNLKNLALCMCQYVTDISHFTIVAPELSRLTMSCCFLDSSICDRKLMLSTPRLTFLKIFDFKLPLLQTDDLAFLDTVDVDVKMGLSMSKETKLLLFSTFISLLKCFHRAKSVRLSSYMVKLLSEFPDELAREPSPFCNLRSVNIVSLHSKTIPVVFPGHVMTYLLGKSPHAKTVFKEQKAGAVLMDA